MFYIRFVGGLPVELSNTCPKDGVQWCSRDGWQSSRDCESYKQAETWSKYLTAMTGRQFLPADEGAGVWPRYRVIEAPAIGDEVSYSFNGDTYPCGTIVKLTPTWQVTTSDGTQFRRYRNTAGWRRVGGTFWMVKGHIYEQNPHF